LKPQESPNYRAWIQSWSKNYCEPRQKNNSDVPNGSSENL
jgi:hypothetical protein